MRSEESRKLYERMLGMNFPERFCRLIAESLSTDFTAGRMNGFFGRCERRPSMEEVADEMLAILSDRDRIVSKKITEHANAKWNEYLYDRRLQADEDEDEYEEGDPSCSER